MPHQIETEAASYGSGLRSRSLEILNGALLRRRYQYHCGLGLNHCRHFLSHQHTLNWPGLDVVRCWFDIQPQHVSLQSND
jgi:hypothetical protein